VLHPHAGRGCKGEARVREWRIAGGRGRRRAQARGCAF
jgi:hypothetical protein